MQGVQPAICRDRNVAEWQNDGQIYLDDNAMAKLTEQEQQDIIRFIEADKPLPEKYRFLLFDDKREVELVWNGKTSEVCNVVLPFQTIEQVDEPRAEKPEDTTAQKDLFSTDSQGASSKAGPTSSSGATTS